MFHEEGNGFNMFVRPQSVLVNNTECKLLFVYKRTS